MALLSDDEAAQDNYEEMRSVAVQHQDRTLELAGLISQSRLHADYTSVFNPLRARELAQEALALARELGDKAAEAGALWGLMGVEFASAGDKDLIMDHGHKALALARELGLKELIGRILTTLCWAYFAQNQIEEAIEALSEAKSIWRELGNLQQLVLATRYKGILYHAVGDHQGMLAEAPKLVELGASIGSRVDEGQGWTHMALVYARQGRFGQALDCTEKVGALSTAIGHANEEHGHQQVRIKLYLAVGALAEAERWADSLYTQRENIMPMLIHSYLTEVALAKILCGKLDEGQAILDELLSSLQADTAASFALIDLAVAYGHMNLALGKPEALFAGLEERVRSFREAGFAARLADQYWLRGRAEMALGQYDAAREALLKARETAEAQEERAVLWQILVSLAEVEQACGNVDAAEQLRDEAREVVGYIVEHAGELREAFLARQEVQALLNAPSN